MICLIEPFIRKFLRMLHKIKLRHVCFVFGVLALLDLFGAFTHICELSYDKYFKYPYEGDVSSFVDALKHKKKPEIPPINEYNYSFNYDLKDYCVDNDYHTLRIVFLVKSAAENFENRNAIRSTWGFKKRFFDVPTRTIFLLGIHENDNELQSKIQEESIKYKDILQANFIDSYYNNTIKTMIGFKWAVTNCLNSKFYMFIDDDMYVSVKNVLAFVRNPAYYPNYLREPNRLGKREIRNLELLNSTTNTINASVNQKVMENRSSWKFFHDKKFPKNMEKNIVINASTTQKILNRKRRQIFDIELPDDVRLFAGYVFTSSPHRHKTSKWYVSLDEYPYHLWPPYITAGAYILSKNALVDMYYTSLYTKHFRFDDIFLGLVAKKADIEPFHCDEFHFYKKDYTKFNYKYVIASHGYGDPNELIQIWNEQKSFGNA